MPIKKSVKAPGTPAECSNCCSRERIRGQLSEPTEHILYPVCECCAGIGITLDVPESLQERIIHLRDARLQKIYDDKTKQTRAVVYHLEKGLDHIVTLFQNVDFTTATRIVEALFGDEERVADWRENVSLLLAEQHALDARREIGNGLHRYRCRLLSLTPEDRANVLQRRDKSIASLQATIQAAERETEEWFRREALPGDIELLTIVTRKWIAHGRPPDCYAAELALTLTRALTPPN